MKTTYGQDQGHKHNPCPPKQDHHKQPKHDKHEPKHDKHPTPTPTVDVAPPPVPNPPCNPQGPNCPAPTPPAPAPTPNPCASPNNTCQPPLTATAEVTTPVVLPGLAPAPAQAVSSVAVQTSGTLPATGSPTEGLVATSAWILLAGIVALAASKIKVRRPA